MVALVIFGVNLEHRFFYDLLLMLLHIRLTLHAEVYARC